MITTELEELYERFKGMSVAELEQEQALRDLPQEDYVELIRHIQDVTPLNALYRAIGVWGCFNPDQAVEQHYRGVEAEDKFNKAFLADELHPSDRAIVALLSEIRDLLKGGSR